MKRYIVRAVLFLLPLLTILCILEFLARKMPSELYVEKKDYIDEHSDDLQLLILGTSQITCGINPDYISIPSLNMANGSQSLEYDYYILDNYIEQLNDLRYIILEVSYQSLYYDMMANNGFRAYYYYQYYGFNYNTDPFSIKKLSVFLIEPNRTMTRMIEYYSDTEKWRENNQSSKGWFNMNGNFIGMTPEEAIRDGEEKYKYHWRKTFENDFLPVNHAHLSRIIALCNEKNVEIILITPPVYKSFSDNIWMEKYTEMQDIIRKITMENKVTYYNFFYDDRFGFEDFYNHNHMNGSGAKKLSIILNDSIIKKMNYETQAIYNYPGNGDNSVFTSVLPTDEH